ncbi:MAG TPA: hypothetical protein ENK31_01485, partial [Nannocystis exedens]|nr:hypothetical protein [Nannocystis exedens]
MLAVASSAGALLGVAGSLAAIYLSGWILTPTVSQAAAFVLFASAIGVAAGVVRAWRRKHAQQAPISPLLATLALPIAICAVASATTGGVATVLLWTLRGQVLDSWRVPTSRAASAPQSRDAWWSDAEPVLSRLRSVHQGMRAVLELARARYDATEPLRQILRDLELPVDRRYLPDLGIESWPFAPPPSGLDGLGQWWPVPLGDREIRAACSAIQTTRNDLLAYVHRMDSDGLWGEFRNQLQLLCGMADTLRMETSEWLGCTRESAAQPPPAVRTRSQNLQVRIMLLEASQTHLGGLASAERKRLASDLGSWLQSWPPRRDVWRAREWLQAHLLDPWLRTPQNGQSAASTEALRRDFVAPLKRLACTGDAWTLQNWMLGSFEELIGPSNLASEEARQRGNRSGATLGLSHKTGPHVDVPKLVDEVLRELRLDRFREQPIWITDNNGAIHASDQYNKGKQREFREAFLASTYADIDAGLLRLQGGIETRAPRVDAKVFLRAKAYEFVMGLVSQAMTHPDVMAQASKPFWEMYPASNGKPTPRASDAAKSAANLLSDSRLCSHLEAQREGNDDITNRQDSISTVNHQREAFRDQCQKVKTALKEGTLDFSTGTGNARTAWKAAGILWPLMFPSDSGSSGFGVTNPFE